VRPLVPSLAVIGSGLCTLPRVGATSPSRRGDGRSKHLKTVSLSLVHQGANLDAKEYGGITPLHEAVCGGKIGVALYLLDSGADPALANVEGWTAVMLAVRGGLQKTTKALLNHKGARQTINNVDVKGAGRVEGVDRTGVRPLAVAREGGDHHPSMRSRLEALALSRAWLSPQGGRRFTTPCTNATRPWCVCWWTRARRPTSATARARRPGTWPAKPTTLTPKRSVVPARQCIRNQVIQVPK
jgi:hypothetical protein